MVNQIKVVIQLPQLISQCPVMEASRSVVKHGTTKVQPFLVAQSQLVVSSIPILFLVLMLLMEDVVMAIQEWLSMDLTNLVQLA